MKKQNIANTVEKNSKVTEIEPEETIEAVSPEPTQAGLPPRIAEVVGQVSKEQLEIVNGMVPGLIPSVLGLEAKVDWLLENMATEEKVKGAFAEVLSKQSQALTQVQQPTQQAGPMGSLLPLLMQAMGGASGSGESELYKELVSTQIQRMKQDMSFTDAIKNAIVSKIAGKAAGSIAEI